MNRMLFAACALALATDLAPAAGAQPSPAVLTGTIAAEADVQLHFEAHGSGSDTLIVLHGGPGLSSAYLAPDIGSLDEGYTVIYYDQRGGGRSTVVTDSARLGMDDHLADLEAVRRHFGLRRMTLLGHSWGAGPAAFYARDHPDQVTRLILHDPMPLRAAPHMEQFGANLGAWMDSSTAARVGDLSRARRSETVDAVAACRDFWAVFIHGYMADPHAPVTMRGDVCDAPPEAIGNAGRVFSSALPGGSWDWRNEFGAVNMPVLVISGAQSPIPAESVDEWMHALPAAERVRIEGAGHFAHYERPAAFREAVNRFLR